MSDIHESLSRTAMVVTTYLSAWSPVKVDRKLAGDVADRRHSTEKAFSVRKNAFSGADSEIKAVTSELAAFRRYHYAITLPFGPGGPTDRGPRLLPNDKFFEYAQRMAGSLNRIEEHLDKFTEVYTQRVQEARAVLGDAFSEDDYPEVDELRDLFGIKADFQPIPDGHAFRGLPEATLQQLAEFTEKRLTAKHAAAVEELVERVEKYVERLRSRLDALETSEAEGGRKATIKSSLFTEAGELASIIRAFDFDNERLRAAIELLDRVAQCDKDALNSPDVRAEVRELTSSSWECFA